jgi:hypothetical protein
LAATADPHEAEAAPYGPVLAWFLLSIRQGLVRSQIDSTLGLGAAPSGKVKTKNGLIGDFPNSVRRISHSIRRDRGIQHRSSRDFT